MRRFSPGWVPTAAMVVAVALLCSLGVWQLRRHQWREALLAEQRARLELPPVPVAEAVRDPDAHRWRRATARGRYDRARTIVVQHVRRGLREGAQVLTPLLREDVDSDASGAPAVLIDRGWVPYREQDRFVSRPAEDAPAPARPSEVVEVTGVVRPMDLGDAQPGTAAEPRTAWLRFNPADPAQPAALQSQLPYRLAPLLLQRQPEPEPAGAVGEAGGGATAGAIGAADRASPESGSSARSRMPTGSPQLPVPATVQPESPVNHLAYAFQWFAFAAIALATWAGLGLKRAREPAPGTRPPRPPSS